LRVDLKMEPPEMAASFFGTVSSQAHNAAFGTSLNARFDTLSTQLK